MKVLVVRNDKLGDFMLAWPALAALKLSVPECRVHVLVSAYTADIARLCPHVDEIVIDPGERADAAERRAFMLALRQQRYDAAITLFSTTRIGLLLWRAGIPVRVAPATKLAQIFYNRRLTQRRSRSEKPEHAYNVDLVRNFLAGLGQTCQEGRPPWLVFPRDETSALRASFCRERGIDPAAALVFIHPGSGGSANNLAVAQYAAIGRALNSADGHHLVISAGPGEIAQAQSLSAQLGESAHSVYHSTEGLERFARHIAFCDVFISGSTGPLHIAGALNRNTAAFYPRRRSSTALRWQTINEEGRRLAFSPPDAAAEDDMSRIDPQAAAASISRTFLAQGAVEQTAR